MSRVSNFCVWASFTILIFFSFPWLGLITENNPQLYFIVRDFRSFDKKRLKVVATVEIQIVN